MEFKREDPPESQSPNYKKDKTREAIIHLKQNLGVWFIVDTCKNKDSGYSRGYNLRRNSGSGFEFVAREKDGVVNVYGRYTPPEHLNGDHP